MIIKTSKQNLRKYALEKRTSEAYLDDNKNLSSKIVSKILNSTDFKKAKHIAIYIPIKGEIDITLLRNIKDKIFYIPRCNMENLEFTEFDNNLYKNKWGITESASNKINPEILDLIYIPTLIANPKNYRLGYGKGYYDRFFRKYKLKAKKILIVSKEFITNDFIEDKFDIPADDIICA